MASDRSKLMLKLAIDNTTAFKTGSAWKVVQNESTESVETILNKEHDMVKQWLESSPDLTHESEHYEPEEMISENASNSKTENVICYEENETEPKQYTELQVVNHLEPAINPESHQTDLIQNYYEETEKLTEFQADPIIPDHDDLDVGREDLPKNTAVDEEMGVNEKKRKGDRKNWKKEIAKRLRNSGEAYVSSRNKPVEKKKVRAPCSNNCRLKCSEKFSEDERQKIFDAYWGAGNLEVQRTFLRSAMVAVVPKYRYPRQNSKRNVNQSYFLKRGDENIRVCKLFFKNTLDINDRRLDTVLKKTEDTGNLVLQDQRGRHSNHPKVDSKLRANIEKHIKSIPTVPSHYCRQNTSKTYIFGDKSISQLHRDYVEDEKKEGRKFGNYQLYYSIFHEFNIGFHQPKKDQCDLCAMFQNDKNDVELNVKYENHITQKNLARIEKDNDKKISDGNSVVAIFDLQAVLPCPNGETSSFYYVSKLAVYNLTFYNLRNKRVKCFMWDETQGSRGVTEVGTCVYNYLESIAAETEKEVDVILYSDNCSGQQKNYALMSMYFEALKKFPKIKSVTHKFLITGHTQNENDSVHSVIERAVKRILANGPIYHPSQYKTAISLARKVGDPYTIVEVSNEDFIDMKQFKNIFPPSLKISELHVIQFRSMDSNIYYKYGYDEDFTQVAMKITKSINVKFRAAYQKKIKINEKKKEGLLKLLEKKIIPQCYKEFYESL